MEQAWAQVGEIERANRELRWAQVAVEVRTARSCAGTRRRSRRASCSRSRRRRTGGCSSGGRRSAATARESALPEASLTAPFRRAVRPRGPLARRAYAPGERDVRPIVEGLDTGSAAGRAARSAARRAVRLRRRPTPARPGVSPEVLARIRPPRPAAATTTAACRHRRLRSVP